MLLMYSELHGQQFKRVLMAKIPSTTVGTQVADVVISCCLLVLCVISQAPSQIYAVVYLLSILTPGAQVRVKHRTAVSIRLPAPYRRTVGRQ